MEIAIVMVIVGIILGGFIGHYMFKEKPNMNALTTTFTPNYAKLNNIVNVFNGLAVAEGRAGNLKINGTTQAVCFNITENGKLVMMGCTSDYNRLIMGVQQSVVTINQIKQMTAQVKANTANITKPLTKLDKPTVQLYVMSHGPFGTEMQKVMIPVAKLFGKKINFEPKFVYYTMHGMIEAQDNSIEYCMNDNYPDKYMNYMKCFLISGNSTECILNVSTSPDKIRNCTTDLDNRYGITKMFNNKSTWLNGKYPLYPVNAADNKKYGVTDSPTLVLNGKIVKIASNPEAIKEAICSAFTNKPPECNVILSNKTPSQGFGKDAAASEPGGWCSQ